MAEPEERERDRFSLIGHASLPFLSPLVEEELVSLLAPAALPAGGLALDVGGGRADLSALLVRRFGLRATSVDRSAQATEQARARTAGLDVTLVCGDAATHLAGVAPGSLALASSVGAVHCFGVCERGWRATLRALGRVATRVLVADLVASTPEAAEAFQIATLEGVRRVLAEDGREPVATLLLDAARVRAYERAWCSSVARHVATHPDDRRNGWARDRLAWAEAPALEAARGALGFYAVIS